MGGGDSTSSLPPVGSRGLRSPSGSGRSPAAKRFLMHFELKIKPLATMVLNKISPSTSLRVLIPSYSSCLTSLHLAYRNAARECEDLVSSLAAMHYIWLRDLRESLGSQVGSGRSPAAKCFLVHFDMKMKSLAIIV